MFAAFPFKSSRRRRIYDLLLICEKMDACELYSGWAEASCELLSLAQEEHDDANCYEADGIPHRFLPDYDSSED